MKTYLFDIIDRFKRFSHELDVKTVLCQKAWFVLNEDGNKEMLIFQSDGKVIVSVNGNASTYTWQYIPQNNSVLINHTDLQGTMLRPAFYNEDILAFQKDGTKECMFMLDDNSDSAKKLKTLEDVKASLVALETAENKRIKAEQDRARYWLSKAEKEKAAEEALAQQKAESEREEAVRQARQARQEAERQRELEAAKEKERQLYAEYRKDIKALHEKHKSEVRDVEVKYYTLCVLGWIIFPCLGGLGLLWPIILSKGLGVDIPIAPPWFGILWFLSILLGLSCPMIWAPLWEKLLNKRDEQVKGILSEDPLYKKWANKKWNYSWI